MIKQFGLLMILLIFVASCAPTGGADNIETEAAPVIEETPLNRSVPTHTSDDPLPTELPEPTNEPQSETDNPAQEQSSGPTVVDLSELTPAPEEESGDTNVVQPAPGVPDVTAKLIQDVSADLSSRLGIDVNEVALVAITETVWRDSSLGCPQPGMAYLQVLTDGYLITLKANGDEHNYHTRGTSTFIYCLENSKASEPITQPIAPDQ